MPTGINKRTETAYECLCITLRAMNAFSLRYYEHGRECDFIAFETDSEQSRKRINQMA